MKSEYWLITYKYQEKVSGWNYGETEKFKTRTKTIKINESWAHWANVEKPDSILFLREISEDEYRDLNTFY